MSMTVNSNINSELPTFNIGDLVINLIQGGMGVGVSGANLASAVSRNGGLGVIASVGLGKLKKYPGSYPEANANALIDEISQAKKNSNGRPVAVNIMRALKDYTTLVQATVKAGADVIISGAGLALDLPNYVKSKSIKLIPIIGSARAAELFCKKWKMKGRIPDALIIEGPKAGGHLAYTKEQLEDNDFIENYFSNIVPNVIEVTNKYGEIPIILAGGFFYGGDIKKAHELGAQGIQMATRFVCTDECDVNYNFKKGYLDAKKEDLIIIRSPVKMLGRAIKNEFLIKVEGLQNRDMIDREKIKCFYHCLETCDRENASYCIAEALISAQRGDLGDGFAFAGANVDKCNEIISVEKLFEKLRKEYRDNIRSK